MMFSLASHGYEISIPSLASPTLPGSHLPLALILIGFHPRLALTAGVHHHHSCQCGSDRAVDFIPQGAGNFPLLPVC